MNSELLARAEEIARAAHKGQSRKDGRPYIEHVEAVVRQLPDDSDTRVVGWLHDVLEDTGMSRQDLEKSGIPDRLINEIQLLTKKREEQYPEYIDRIKASALATQVKKADIIANLLDKPGNRQIVRFAQALIRLCNRGSDRKQ